MIKLHEGGVYLVDGQLVPAAQAQGDPRLQDATPQQAKKATIAYSILQAHNHSGDPASLQIRFDALASHDITYVGIIQTARASGMEKFPMPYVLTNCHNSLCAVGGTINEDDHMFGLSAAKKYGGIYVPRHIRRSSTQYMREMHGRLRQDDPGLRQPHPLRRSGHHGRGRGRRRAGQAAAGRHLGHPLSRGGGHLPHRQAPALAWAPTTWPWPSARPSMPSGYVKNKVMEFVGPGVASLATDYRNGIDVMTTETTCLSSIWQTDEDTKAWLTAHGRGERLPRAETRRGGLLRRLRGDRPVRHRAHDRPALPPLQRLHHR